MDIRKSFSFLLIFLYSSSTTPGYALANNLIDLTIDQAIALAIKNNISIEIEELKLTNKKSDSIKYRSEYIPSLRFDQSFNRLQDQPGTEGLEVDQIRYNLAIVQKLPFGAELTISRAITKDSYSSYDATIVDYRLNGYNLESYDREYTYPSNIEYSSEVALTYVQPILSGGLFGPAYTNIELAGYDERIQASEISIRKAKLIEATKVAFYKVLKYQNIVLVYDEGVKISDELFRLVKSQSDLGLASEQDVILAEIELMESKADNLSAIQLLESVRLELMNLFNMDVNIKISNEYPKKGSQSRINEAIAPASDLEKQIKNIYSIALEKNPRIKMLYNQIKRQNFNLSISNNNLLPKLDFVAKYKQSGKENSLSQANELKGRNYQIGLSFSYPLYNRRLTENHQQQRNNLEILRLNLSKLRNELAISISSIVRQIDFADKQERSRKAQIQTITEQFQSLKTALKQGVITQDKVFVVRDKLLEAKLQYHAVMYEKLRLGAALDLIIGW